MYPLVPCSVSTVCIFVLTLGLSVPPCYLCMSLMVSYGVYVYMLIDFLSVCLSLYYLCVSMLSLCSLHVFLCVSLCRLCVCLEVHRCCPVSVLSLCCFQCLDVSWCCRGMPVSMLPVCSCFSVFTTCVSVDSALRFVA